MTTATCGIRCRRHARLVVEDPAEVLAVGKDLGLERQERAARVHEVDAGQPVLLGDLLGAQVLLDRHREVRAALDRRVVGDDHDLAARDTRPIAGHEAGARRLAVVHPVGGERRELEERRARVEQRVDAVAHEHLLLLGVALAAGPALRAPSRAPRAAAATRRLHRAASAPGTPAERGRRGWEAGSIETRQPPARPSLAASLRMKSTRVCVGVPGRKISRMPSAFSGRDVLVGNDPAGDDQDVLAALLLQELQDLGKEDVVRAGEDREADDVHVLLDRPRRRSARASGAGPSR